MKIAIFIILLIICSICLINFSGSIKSNVFAANGNSTSDLQLMARAINRRGKGRDI